MRCPNLLGVRCQKVHGLRIHQKFGRLPRRSRSGGSASSTRPQSLDIIVLIRRATSRCIAVSEGELARQLLVLRMRQPPNDLAADQR
jgi:hypothetical protein